MTGVGVGEELLWLEGEENLKTTKRAINKSIRGIIKMSLGNFEEDDDRDSISKREVVASEPRRLDE